MFRILVVEDDRVIADKNKNTPGKMGLSDRVRSRFCKCAGSF